jgi:ubiquinone/menaquinone biosynthesis C-methylase UbiE
MMTEKFKRRSRARSSILPGRMSEPILPKSNAADYQLTEVRALFNAKARTWNQKYQAGGALIFRITVFERLLASRLSPAAKVLDLGCGTAAIASALSAGGFRVTACDFAEEMIEAGKRIYKQSTIEWCLLPPDWKQLPFEACTFDGVVASSVLEYLHDVNGVMGECHRVLKPGGIMIATVPNPRTLTRKLEKIVRSAAAVLDRVPGFDRIPKLHFYTTYLKCSQNRMSLDEWLATGTRANFVVIDPIEIDARNASLAFLLFRKPTTEAEQ